jgi:LDH2 family malate/lactate/ureidoglycolate dehydrogenase
LPGEPEHETRLEYEADGIPLTDGAIDALTELAEERGVSTPLF